MQTVEEISLHDKQPFTFHHYFKHEMEQQKISGLSTNRERKNELKD
jgi:hypothetical protein